MMAVIRHPLGRSTLFALVALAAMGCAHRPPTIAHTHIGHAITGFDGTPDDQGLFEVAEQRAEAALVHARAAVQDSPDLATLRRHVGAVMEETTAAPYSLKQSLLEAASHVRFAATSTDASDNVRATTPRVEAAATEVVNRCDLIALLGNDVLATDSLESGRLLAGQIRNLAETNVRGGDGAGVVQIRQMLDAMVAAEDPPYVTVDRWYLFHLVRLPDCDNCWAWRKWADSSNRGY